MVSSVGSIMTASKEFLDSLEWKKILEHLRLRLTVPELPTSGECPFCRNLAIFVPDEEDGGQWGYCKTCRFAGDVLHWAARIWGVDIEAAYARLRLVGLGSPKWFALPRNYVDASRLLRQVQRLWEDADARWLQESLGRQVFQHYGWLASATHWRQKLGRLLRATTAQRVEEYLGRWIFPSRQWNELWFWPYWSFPGKLVGLQFWKVDGESWHWSMHPRRKVRAGWAGLEGGWWPESDRYLIVDSPDVIWKLQDRWLRDRDDLAPFVCCSSGGWCDYVPWGKQLCVWLSQWSIGALEWARKKQAVVVYPGLTRDRIGLDLGRLRSEHWLDRAFRLGRSWGESLGVYLRNCSEAEWTGACRDLGWTRGEWEFYLRVFPCETIRKKLEACQVGSLTRVVDLGDQKLLEKEGCWWLEKNGKQQLASSAVIRLEEAWYPWRGELWYRGRIWSRGEGIEFFEASRKLQQEGFAWVQRYLAQHGHTDYYYNVKHVRQLVSWSVRLSPPGKVDVPPGNGWHEKTGRFYFEHFSIDLQGNLLEGLPWQDLRPVHSTMHLKRPAGLSPWVVSKLSRYDRRNSMAWALTVAILGNLLAPLYQRSATGIALAGTGGRYLGRWFSRFLGCGEAYFKELGNLARERF
ncbi:MAG: hypothetical protein QXS68_07950, partial [Candidatus Methanomethylicaceae archaeon]